MSTNEPGGTRFHQEAGEPEPLDEILSGLI
jgi:hypothetical protein